jgi:DNA (cytosine-5)-methyltransferase 1
VLDGTPTERRGGAPFGVRRLRPDEPCKAITAAAVSELLHPSEDRNLTVRECARAQAFPDDFVFTGTTSEQAQQVGNAVPPLLARAVAVALLEGLARARPVEGRGALLSFVPTLSSGRSPALESVSRLVRQTFQGAGRAKERLLWD